jgi:hypothetical protein
MILNLLRKLTRKPPLLPRSASDIGSYQSHFEQAAVFSASCGFAVAKPIWLPGDALDSDGSFIEPPMRRAGVIDAGASAGQCLKWSHYLAPEFEKQLGRTVWVTIGQLWKDDTAVFSPTWDDLRRWSGHGITIDELQKKGRPGVNLHAWLTVDSGEIIDVTFPSSLAKFGGTSYAWLAGSVVWGRDPGVIPRHRYYPMAIGRDFAEAIGKQSMLPLLATNAAELHSFLAILARPGF